MLTEQEVRGVHYSSMAPSRLVKDHSDPSMSGSKSNLDLVAFDRKT